MKIRRLTKQIVSMILVTILCFNDGMMSFDSYAKSEETNCNDNMSVCENVSDDDLPELSGDYDDYIVKPTMVETTLASSGNKGSLIWSIDSKGHLYINGSGQPEFVPYRL